MVTLSIADQLCQVELPVVWTLLSMCLCVASVFSVLFVSRTCVSLHVLQARVMERRSVCSAGTPTLPASNKHTSGHNENENRTTRPRLLMSTGMSTMTHDPVQRQSENKFICGSTPPQSLVINRKGTPKLRKVQNGVPQRGKNSNKHDRGASCRFFSLAERTKYQSPTHWV